jgi:hypothetical protein
MAAKRAELEEWRDKWDKEMQVLRDQLETLKFQLAYQEKMKNALEKIGTYLTDQDDGSIVPPIVLQSAVDVGEAQVTVLQAGFTELQAELAGVRSDISALTREVRNGLEVAVGGRGS